MYSNLIEALGLESTRLTNEIAREPKALSKEFSRNRQQKAKILRCIRALERAPNLEVASKAHALLDRQAKEFVMLRALRNFED